MFQLYNCATDVIRVEDKINNKKEKTIRLLNKKSDKKIDIVIETSLSKIKRTPG
jgi:hypothetical protein